MRGERRPSREWAGGWRKSLGKKGGWAEQKAERVSLGMKGRVETVPRAGRSSFLSFRSFLVNCNPQGEPSLPPDFANTILFPYCLRLFSCC